MDSLSNWGRWGADDVLGTLNHITPDKRRQAAALVKEGRVVSCAWDIRARAMPGAVNRPQRYMLGTGLDLGVGPATARPGQMDQGHAGAAMEFIGLVFHGLAITHIDALSHVFWDRKMYNGLPASLVTDWNGATRRDVPTSNRAIRRPAGRGCTSAASRRRSEAVEEAVQHCPAPVGRVAQHAVTAIGKAFEANQRFGKVGGDLFGSRHRCDRGSTDRRWTGRCGPVHDGRSTRSGPAPPGGSTGA